MPPEPANLPAVPAGDELVGVVVDEPRRPAYTLRVVSVITRHPVPRATVRHAGYVPAGLVVAWRRRRHARQRPERMMQQAEVQGDHAQVIAWRQQLEAEKQSRHGRVVKTAETVMALARNALVIGGALLGAMTVLSVLLAIKWKLHGFLWPWETAAEIAVWAVSILGVLWVALVLGFATTVLGVLHELGRRGGSMAPKWTRTAADDDADIVIDERAVTQALANLRITQVKDYLKAGHPLQFLVPCRQEGRGTGFEVRTPGIAAEQVVRRRAHVAAGLYRLPKETWLSVGADASILKGWIADKGALDEGAGEYPLLSEGFTDVFKGLPFGRTLRGDPVKIPVIGRNSIVGGAPEQGKSNSARVTACGYTLDVITELRIYVPDANFDFDAFAPRCSRYLVGAEDEVIERMLEEQELLKEELQQRGQLLRDYEVQEVTYEIAHAGVGLHPVYNLVEEAHVCIQHRKYGKDFGQLLGENVKLCRKRGEHIEVSTQAPVRGSMPRDVTTNCTVGIAHALSDIYANDAILGPGAHSGGHRATELIPGTDRGIALCKGFEGEARSEMVQAYRITTAQVPAIVARAMAELARQGRPVPGAERGPLAIVSRDLLTDLDTVLAHRNGTVRIADVPGMLRNLAKSWGPYRSLNGKELRRLLGEEGVRTTNPGNVPTLDTDELRRVVREREVS